MLEIFDRLDPIDFRQLMDVYEETNQLSGARDYPQEIVGLQVLFAEQDFYQYLELFFKELGSLCAVWRVEERYTAALRLERHLDGVLITALEVAPKARRKGYGAKLIEAVKQYAQKQSITPIYSHVSKDNTASLATHKKCGFAILKDGAVFLDGTTHRDHYTLIWK